MVRRGVQEKLSEAEVRWEVRRGSRRGRQTKEVGEEVGRGIRRGGPDRISRSGDKTVRSLHEEEKRFKKRRSFLRRVRKKVNEKYQQYLEVKL
jgi:hypothetical protein